METSFFKRIQLWTDRRSSSKSSLIKVILFPEFGFERGERELGVGGWGWERISTCNKSTVSVKRGVIAERCLQCQRSGFCSLTVYVTGPKIQAL